MKKNILYIACFVALTTVFTSCKKEDFRPNHHPKNDSPCNLEVKNNKLPDPK